MMNGKLHGVHWFQWVGKLKWNDCKSQIWRNSCEDFHSPFCFTQIFCLGSFLPTAYVMLSLQGWWSFPNLVFKWCGLYWMRLLKSSQPNTHEASRKVPWQFFHKEQTYPLPGEMEKSSSKGAFKRGNMLVFSRVQVCGNVKLASSALHMLQPIASWCPLGHVFFCRFVSCQESV